jgi:hypothetical protein
LLRLFSIMVLERYWSVFFGSKKMTRLLALPEF